MEDLIFVGIDMESLQVDYEDWKDQFVEFTEHEKDGYRFLLVNNQMEKKIVLYEELLFYDQEAQIYVLKLTRIVSFNDYAEALDLCTSIIERYVCGEYQKDEEKASDAI